MIKQHKMVLCYYDCYETPGYKAEPISAAEERERGIFGVITLAYDRTIKDIIYCGTIL